MKYLFFLSCLLWSMVLNGQVAEGTPINAEISYLKFGRKVDVNITLQFPVVSDKPFLIGNLRDYYGYPSLGKFMTGLRGNNGTLVTKNPSDSISIAPSKNKVDFTYTLSYDSASFSDNTYAPNVGVSHVHFAFCQWMLPLADRKVVLNYQIQIGNLPQNWILYSSATQKPKAILLKTSMAESFSMVIGAGAFYKYAYNLKGKPLSVYVKGNFTAGNKRLSELVYKIVNSQHTWFNDFQFPFYNVVLLPKEGNVAGISIPNMFLCHIKKDVDFQKLAWLMSHEMLHRWVGNRIVINDTTRFKLRHQWFKEGINDYLSYLVLLDSKLFSRDEFISSINSYLKNIKENPYGDASEDSINRVITLGKYGVAATKLPYYKGGVIGFLADKEYLKQSKTGVQSRVKDFVIRLLKENVNGEKIIVNENRLFALADSMQIPLYSLYQKHIINGDPDFDLPKQIFDGIYSLKKVEYQVYDLGFSFVEKENKLFASSVNELSPAYKAGLRNDMEIASTTSVNRFSNAWCDCPVKLIVLINGKQKPIVYLPRGKKAEVFQYLKTAM